MKYDFLKFGLPTAASLFLAAGAMAQVNNPEIEPNETKATATVAASGGAGMVAGDTISGTTTGASATAGATSLDTFRVKTAAAELGIYRYQLALSSTTLFQTGTIRGLTQTSTGIAAASDVAVQTSSATTNPARFNQWYGFGRQEEIYYRVTGTATSTGSYTSTLTRDRVDAVAIPGTSLPGLVTVQPDLTTANALDTDYWVYDSSFNAVPTFGHDNLDFPGVSRTLAAGTYYVAMAVVNLANNQPAATDDTTRTGNVLDFPNAIACSSTVIHASISAQTVDSAGITNTATSNRDAYGIAWFSFVVAEPTSPLGAGAASPVGVPDDGTGSVLFTVRTVGAVMPTSTGITVAGDFSTIGGSGVQAFFDNGTNGDVTSGDGIFSFRQTVPAGTPQGPTSVQFTVADAQGRSSSGSISLNVINPPITIEDLGDLSSPVVTLQRTLDVAGGAATWYRLSLSQPVRASLGTLLDIDTETAPVGDTELGLYRADGVLAATDDDDGSGLLSQLSFGAGTRPAVGTSVAYNGRDGELPAGVYYLAVAQFNAIFTNDFTVTSGAAGLFGVNLNIRTESPSTPPTGTGAATPNSVANDGTGSTLFTVSTQPGATPVSTGITVTGDLTNVGGSSTQLFFDNGTNGDVTVGDRIFSFAYSIPAGIQVGTRVIPFAVADAEGRTSNAQFTLVLTGTPTVIENLGNLSLPVQINRTVDVAAGGASFYLFTLSQDASAPLGTFLDIDTEGTFGDTELGVYRTDGTLVVSDDNDGSGLLTQLSFGAGTRPAVGNSVAYNGRDGVLTAGTYYLAVAQFNAVFGSGFNISSTGVGLAGVQVNLRSISDPVAPTGTGAATPNTFGNDGTFSTIFRVTVQSGSSPASTNLAVSLDTSSIGGTTLVLLDNGVGPDLVAGDNIFSASFAVPASTLEGANPLPFTITDGEARMGFGNINTTIFTPVGACCTTNGCSIKSRALCDAEGGIYLGNSIQCSDGDGYPITDSVRVFASISADPSAVRQGLTDDSNVLVDIGFDFTFFGTPSAQVFVGSNGFLTFTAAGQNTLGNVAIPAPGVPNNAIYGFWDDINPGVAQAAFPNGVFTLTRGEAPNREFIVSYEGIPQFANTDSNTFQIILSESGRVDFVYGSVTATVPGDVTIGIENPDGTSATSIDSQSIGTGNTARTAVFTPGQSNCPSGCAPDFNGDGTLDPDDLADFINAFFAQPPNPAADYDNSGSVDPDDLSTYITEFFAGCP